MKTVSVSDQENFRLIMVPFGGITGKQIEEHEAWKPAFVDRLQVLPRDGLNESDEGAVNTIFEEIINNLKELLIPSTFFGLGIRSIENKEQADKLLL